MTVTRLSVSAGVILIPSLRRVQFPRAFGSVSIPVGPATIIGTLPVIEAMNNPVIIEFAGMFNNSGGVASAVFVELFRDGVQIADASDIFGVAIGVAPYVSDVLTGLWMDETPGLNPVYDFRAISTGAGTTVTQRRGVAHT